MKIQNKTLMYRIDKIKLIDLDTLIEEACADNVPDYASVSIRTDGSGTHVVFEWVEQKVPENPYVKKPYTSKWYENKPYYQYKSKPYKPF